MIRSFKWPTGTLLGVDPLSTNARAISRSEIRGSQLRCFELYLMPSGKAEERMNTRREKRKGKS